MPEQPTVPDVLWGPWTPQHSKDLYFNPDTEKAEGIRLSIEITKEELALREKLMPYWFAKATKFIHEDPKVPVACVVVRVHGLEEPPTLIRWGLVGDEDHWARAVHYGGQWRHLKPHETWHFAYELNSNKTHLENICFFVNDELVTEF